MQHFSLSDSEKDKEKIARLTRTVMKQLSFWGPHQLFLARSTQGGFFVKVTQFSVKIRDAPEGEECGWLDDVM